MGRASIALAKKMKFVFLLGILSLLVISCLSERGNASVVKETVGDSLVREVREAKTRQSNLGGRARGGKRKKLNWIKKQKTKGREKKNVKQGKEKIKGNKKRKNKNKTQRGKGSTMKNNKKTQQRIKGNHKKTELTKLKT